MAAQIHINQAEAAQLKQIPEIGDKAAAVVEARPFTDWSDLRRAGLEPSDIDAIKSQGVQLGESSQGPIGEPGSGGSGGSPAGNMGRA